MKRLLASAALAFLAVTGSALAQSPDDKQSDGNFTGIVLVTDDLDWFAKFQRPETPNISLRSHLAVGDSATLAILFSNATAKDGVISIVCDVSTFGPDGAQLLVDAGPCYDGPAVPPNVLIPTLLNITFTIDADDAAGKAGFDLTLRDVHGGRSVDLKVGFTRGPNP